MSIRINNNTPVNSCFLWKGSWIKLPYAVFCDSHGGFWTKCAGGNHPDAKAFGPSGVFRAVRIAGCSSLAQAKERDIIIPTYREEEDGWLLVG